MSSCKGQPIRQKKIQKKGNKRKRDRENREGERENIQVLLGNVKAPV